MAPHPLLIPIFLFLGTWNFIFPPVSSQLQGVHCSARLLNTLYSHSCIYNSDDESIYIFGGYRTVYGEPEPYRGVLKYSTVNDEIQELPNMTMPYEFASGLSIVKDGSGCMVMPAGEEGLCKFCPSDLQGECINMTTPLKEGRTFLHQDRLLHFGEGGLHEIRADGVVTLLLQNPPTRCVMYKEGSIYCLQEGQYSILDVESLTINSAPFPINPYVHDVPYTIQGYQEVWALDGGRGYAFRGVYKIDLEQGQILPWNVEPYPFQGDTEYKGVPMLTCMDAKRGRLYMLGIRPSSPEIWYVDLNPAYNSTMTPSPPPTSPMTSTTEEPTTEPCCGAGYLKFSAFMCTALVVFIIQFGF